MDLAGSVTWLVQRLKAGHDSALRPLMRRFWPLMLTHARRRIDPGRSPDAGVEDAAQQALWDLARGLHDGRWKQLDNRRDLVAVLLCLTDRRALNLVRRPRLPTLDEQALDGPDSHGQSQGLAQVPDPEPPPDCLVLEEERRRRFIGKLGPSLRPFFDMLLDEWPIARMAEAMRCSERTVHRKLALIRGRWLDEFGQP